MRIIIQTIPHKNQRYDTVGDYQYLSDGTLYITVSEMNDEKAESLVAIHELIEERLTKWAGIKGEDIDKFDINFEKKRKKGNVDEPGFDKDAPYLKQHSFATSVEMGMCAMAGIGWKEYDEKVTNL